MAMRSDRQRRHRTRDGRSSFLLVCHVGGGGTERHLREVAELLSRVGDVYWLKIAAPGSHGTGDRQQLSLIPLCPRGEARRFDFESEFEELLELLQRLGLSRAHFHHTLGHEGHLEELVLGLGIPFDITLHDYRLLSPSFVLCGPDGFHGEPDSTNEIAQSEAGRIGWTLAGWRDSYRWFLARAARIITPSVDCKLRFERYFPELGIIAASHPDVSGVELPTPDPKPPSNGGPLRILTLGAFYRHKGADVLVEVARRSEAEDLPLEFHHLGELPEHPADSLSSRLTVHGRYRDADLGAWLARLRPHVAWFPAQWPETYSYTLSAALLARLPIVATDLGAHPERLGGRPWTWLCPWQAGAPVWCRTLVSVRDRLLACDPPTEPPTLARASSTFYPDEYLEPFTS